jgi:hypothetical protein
MTAKKPDALKRLDLRSKLADAETEREDALAELEAINFEKLSNAYTKASMLVMSLRDQLEDLYPDGFDLIRGEDTYHG